MLTLRGSGSRALNPCIRDFAPTPVLDLPAPVAGSCNQGSPRDAQPLPPSSRNPAIKAMQQGWAASPTSCPSTHLLLTPTSAGPPSLPTVHPNGPQSPGPCGETGHPSWDRQTGSLRRGHIGVLPTHHCHGALLGFSKSTHPSPSIHGRRNGRGRGLSSTVRAPA